MSNIVPMDKRITVHEVSASTTQHSLSIHLDGRAVIAVDNSWRGGFGEGKRTYHGDYRDWMLHRAEDVSNALKVWFVQRFMKFTSGPVGVFYERDFDQEFMRLRAIEREHGGIFADAVAEGSLVERERVRA